MDAPVKRLPVTIRNAVLQFCFEDRIEDVRSFEQYFTSQQLAEFGYPNLGGTSNRLEAKQLAAGQANCFRSLVAAWKGLLLDFRARLERGEIVVTGVQTRPNPTTERTVIPGEWAADFNIDALNNTIEFRRSRFLAIQVGEPECIAASMAVEQKPVAAEPTRDATPKLTVESIGDLTDDQVFILLEEHARRVVETPDAKLFPGKISYAPIIRRRMLFRAEQGEMRSNVASEARDLAAWLKAKIPSHQTPSAKLIENHIRDGYKAEKARSNATKP